MVRLIIILLFIPTISFSQELVIDDSFESTTIIETDFGFSSETIDLSTGDVEFTDYTKVGEDRYESIKIDKDNSFKFGEVVIRRNNNIDNENLLIKKDSSWVRK